MKKSEGKRSISVGGKERSEDGKRRGGRLGVAEIHMRHLSKMHIVVEV